VVGLEEEWVEVGPLVVDGVLEAGCSQGVDMTSIEASLAWFSWCYIAAFIAPSQNNARS
jgi:hypothetical protein